MKRIIALAFILCCCNCIFAQTDVQSNTKDVDYIIYHMFIPKNMRLKDKIIVKNKTNYYIGLASVALCKNEQYIPLGSCLELIPGKEYVVVSYENNELKKIRNKTIAVKLKGFRSALGDQDKNLNNIDPKAFKMRVSEDSHDLIIDLYNSTSQIDNPFAIW